MQRIGDVVTHSMNFVMYVLDGHVRVWFMSLLVNYSRDVCYILLLPAEVTAFTNYIALEANISRPTCTNSGAVYCEYTYQSQS